MMTRHACLLVCSPDPATCRNAVSNHHSCTGIIHEAFYIMTYDALAIVKCACDCAVRMFMVSDTSVGPTQHLLFTSQLDA